MNWNELFVEPEGKINPKKRQQASYLRRKFSIDKKVTSATLILTACGLYQANINGRSVDDQVFMPGFTDYDNRLQYQTYDVTDLITQGQNVIGVMLGDGWFRGNVGIFSKRNLFGEKVKLLSILEIDFEDKSAETITTDKRWKATQHGPIVASDWKDGEVYDARLELGNWSSPSYDDSDWHGVFESSYNGSLVASEGERILEHERFKPDVLTTPDGSLVLDFGQNLFGYVQFKVSGKSGHKVKLRHGETLDESGNFTLKNLSPEGQVILKPAPLLQEVVYSLKEGEQSYKPSFTAHGFRYVKLENWPEPAKPDNFTSIAVYSDMMQTGFFECSHPLINQLVNNTKWSQKGNFLDVPTDCPTRERAPWTGDIASYCGTASYLMDTRKFLKKWLKDLSLRQREDGCVQNHIPSMGMDGFIDGSAGWGDAAVIVPYVLYRVYGDKEILENQYESMVKWIGFLEKRARRTHPFRWLKKNPYKAYTIDTGYHWGEWLEPGNVMFHDVIKNTIKSDSEVSTAYYAYSTRLLSEMAFVLGRNEEGEKYLALAENIKKAYRYNFTNNGIVDSKRFCKYVRPVALDLIGEDEKRENMRLLNAMITENEYKIGTGFLTTPFILPLLTDFGFTETAYKMIENTQRPGWLYAVENGATTIWENWNGIDDNGVPRDSFNHYAFGAVVSWLFSHTAGINPLEPGYEKIRIKPIPGGSLSFANCTFDSPSGTIKSEWKIGSGSFKLTVDVPVEAQIDLPDGTKHSVGNGFHSFECPL